MEKNTHNENLNKTIKSTSILMLTAIIWGTAFVAQRAGMDFVGPFFFNGARMVLGALTVIIVYVITSRKNPFKVDKVTLMGGIVAGLVLFTASSLQQVGLVFTSAGKSGFLTTLYIVLVPILGMFIGHKNHWNTWVSVGIATVGLYFLSVTEKLTIAPGDTILLIGAIFWATHILVIDNYVAKADVVQLSYIQFAIVAIISLAICPFVDNYFIAGEQDWDAIVKAIPTIAYAGILSSGAGYTLQAVGQKYANPTAASIILSLEAVFGILGGVIILGESFSTREIFGCILMFTAVILSQLPVKGAQEKL